MRDSVLLLLATMRMTRLVTTDDLGGMLLREPVARAASSSPTARRLASGLECPFCVGYWIGAAAVLSHAATARSPRLRSAWRLAAATLALNEVAGHLAIRVGDV